MKKKIVKSDPSPMIPMTLRLLNIALVKGVQEKEEKNEKDSFKRVDPS